MIWTLRVLFLSILILMLFVTIKAGINENMFTAGGRILRDPWAFATLCDAYCGFFTFYAWVFYREKTFGRRLVWFVLIMGLGNIAMSLYALFRLFSVTPATHLSHVLLREDH